MSDDMSASEYEKEEIALKEQAINQKAAQFDQI